MQTLEPPDTHFLLAAEGWLGLGNSTEALTELNQISPLHQNDPLVLEMRWAAFALVRDWSSALDVARQLLKHAPHESGGWLNYAYALRRSPRGGLQAAQAALQPAMDKFPQNGTIPYNLACYACQLKQLDEARIMFHRALEVDGREKIKKMALNDSDLRPLWDEIRNC